jgi:tRNA 5-methylaminomethyl-2-thiouridine biosynthesis bifunctional protein
MFGSYIAPVGDDIWTLGATFQQNNDNPAANNEDDTKNIQSAQNILGSQEFTITDHWANIRTASRDRFPIVGPYKNQYILGALGSHGIQFSFLLAEILACQITGAPLPIGRDALQALSTNRFVKTP